jgi:hypothetical protein
MKTVRDGEERKTERDIEIKAVGDKGKESKQGREKQ